jgi:hypothetical protein
MPLTEEERLGANSAVAKRTALVHRIQNEKQVMRDIIKLRRLTKALTTKRDSKECSIAWPS